MHSPIFVHSNHAIIYSISLNSSTTTRESSRSSIQNDSAISGVIFVSFLDKTFLFASNADRSPPHIHYLRFPIQLSFSFSFSLSLKMSCHFPLFNKLSTSLQPYREQEDGTAIAWHTSNQASNASPASHCRPPLTCASTDVCSFVYLFIFPST